MDWDHLDNQWRVDPNNPRIILSQLCFDEAHDHDIMIGVMDTPEIAEHIVKVHNDKLTENAIAEG